MTSHREGSDGRLEVIDFRARPNLPEYAAYLFPRLDAIAQETGGRFGAYRAPVDSLDEFVNRLDLVGIDRAVFAARNRESSRGWALTNEFVAECVNRYPARLVGFAGVDLLSSIPVEDQIRRSVLELGFLGVCIDPFQLTVDAADDYLTPVYTTCSDLQVPAFVTLGGMPGVAAPLACGNPMALDVVAERFPDLVLIGPHAGWPFVTEMIAVAWRRENVWFENSFYHDAPGAEVLVDAANTMIGHKMLYASAYPFAPLDETLEKFRALGFEPEVLDAVLGGNAQRLLSQVASRRA